MLTVRIAPVDPSAINNPPTPCFFDSKTLLAKSSQSHEPPQNDLVAIQLHCRRSFARDAEGSALLLESLPSLIAQLLPHFTIHTPDNHHLPYQISIAPSALLLSKIAYYDYRISLVLSENSKDEPDLRPLAPPRSAPGSGSLCEISAPPWPPHGNV